MADPRNGSGSVATTATSSIRKVEYGRTFITPSRDNATTIDASAYSPSLRRRASWLCNRNSPLIPGDLLSVVNKAPAVCPARPKLEIRLFDRQIHVNFLLVNGELSNELS